MNKSKQKEVNIITKSLDEIKLKSKCFSDLSDFFLDIANSDDMSITVPMRLKCAELIAKIQKEEINIQEKLTKIDPKKLKLEDLDYLESEF